MELVKDVDTEYKDYLRIRSVLKKGYSHPGIISSLCKKHWTDNEKIKDVRAILGADTVSDREKEFYLPELFKLIDSLEVPELIGEFSNEYIS